MRKAKYSAKKVYLPHASRIGFSVSYAKPGHWVSYTQGDRTCTGRVLGRIDATASDGGPDCAGFLAVMQLGDSLCHAYVRFVDPAEVLDCRMEPPRELFAWITGTDWPTKGADVGRLVAMAEHGSTSESYIASRNDPDKAYNRSPEYVAQFILK